MFAELLTRIESLEAKLDQTVRPGLVVSSFPERGTVRVELPDSERLVTFELPVLFAKTNKDRFYAMPDVGEHVLCVFLPTGLEQGFVLGAFYSKADPVPVVSQDKVHVVFDDDTWVEYDRKEHVLNVQVKGDIVIRAENLLHLSAKVVKIHADQILKQDVEGYGDWLVHDAGTTWHTETFHDGSVFDSNIEHGIDQPEIP